MIPASEADMPHVAGWLSHNGDVIEVLNLAALTPGPVAVTPPIAALAAHEART
jgi:chromate transport protein ChrA